MLEPETDGCTNRPDCTNDLHVMSCLSRRRLIDAVPDELPEWERELLIQQHHDAVNHPKHYGGDTTYEVVKVAEAWGLDQDAYLFSLLKYVGRNGRKAGHSPLEDLEKAAWYLNRRIRRLRGEDTSTDSVQTAYERGWRDACDDHLDQDRDPDHPIGERYQQPYDPQLPEVPRKSA